ncbi:hypothetical protein [Cytobacillus dafuensis]|uniref:Uncharacterized protein n=1 Tax=Cytobacillus dafuensis TaxID=1742359 RepID=A0A5B8Z4N7_CYTDA|nr:hypothetical protein [Cytobacillus dafuensis]QED48025.1 hypothetical protein FSZ17_12665 [Cytobacillus dafuensis]
MNAHKKKRNTWVWISFFLFGIMVLIVVIIYLYFFSKSGYVYERKILGKMEDLHGVEFLVTDRLERNEDGYRMLVVSPKDEPTTTFIAERNSGAHAEGGLPYWGKLGEDYRDTRYFYHYPELVEKHFGIEPQDLISLYWEAVKADEPFYFDKAIREKPSQYVPVTLTNMDETIRKAKAFFEDGQQHKIYELHMIYQDERLPKDESPNLLVDMDHVFILEGVNEYQHDRFGNSTDLLSEKELKEQTLEQIKNILYRAFEHQFDKLYTFQEQEEVAIWSLSPRFDDQLTHYSLEVDIDTEQYTSPEKDELYKIYSKVWHLMETMKPFHATEVVFIFPGDERRMVYTLQDQDNARVVNKEIFYANLQPQNSSE